MIISLKSIKVWLCTEGKVNILYLLSLVDLIFYDFSSPALMIE